MSDGKSWSALEEALTQARVLLNTHRIQAGTGWAILALACAVADLPVNTKTKTKLVIVPEGEEEKHE